jgi:hypothetical protein
MQPGGNSTLLLIIHAEDRTGSLIWKSTTPILRMFIEGKPDYYCLVLHSFHAWSWLRQVLRREVPTREPSGLTTIHTTYCNGAIYHTSSGARREMVYGKINIYFFASSLGDLATNG